MRKTVMLTPAETATAVREYAMRRLGISRLREGVTVTLHCGQCPLVLRDPDALPGPDVYAEVEIDDATKAAEAQGLKVPNGTLDGRIAWAFPFIGVLVFAVMSGYIAGPHWLDVIGGLGR